MTLVPRFSGVCPLMRKTDLSPRCLGSIRLLAIFSMALLCLISFNSSVFAQTESSKPDPNRHFYTIVQAPDGSTLCRVATPQEREKLVNRSSSGRVLHQINHLRDTAKSGPSAQVNDSSLPGLKIFLLATDQLENFPAAKAAFIRAAAAWEAVIKTPMTVYLDVDYGPTNFGDPWGSASVIGSTGTRRITRDYPSVRHNLIVSASNSAESTIYNLLPLTSIPTDGGNSGTMSVNVSIARALGFVDANANIQNLRQEIGFNSNFVFDTDSSNGITPGQMDFEAVATHEIGHALGFDSANGEGGTPPRLAVWDLFRFRPGVTDFTNTPRIMSIGGGLQIYYAGGAEIGLSTGGPDPDDADDNDGDGEQSSHWRESIGANNFIGIMDPTIAKGVHQFIKDTDTSALNFMGYNLEAHTPPPPPPPPPAAPANNNFASAQAITGCSGSINGTNVGANKESGEPSHSPDNNPGGASVWYSWQAPATGSVTINTSGSNYDTLLGVYTGNSVGGLTLIIRNDDVTLGQVVSSTATFTATANTTYRIAVDGYGGDTGNIVLNWSQQDCGAPPPPPPPQNAVLSFVQTSVNTNEGVGSIEITVQRTVNLSAAVSVEYESIDQAGLQNCDLINGIASPRCDFVNVVGKLSFAANETVKNISIPIVDDRHAEGGETFNIQLKNPAGSAQLGASTSVISIADNGNDGLGQANPITDPTFFVRQHYIDFLGREPDPLSAGWVNMINQCAPTDQSCRLSVSQGIYGSPEFRDRGYFIYKFFSVALGRKPGYNEFVLDRARVSGFQTTAELEQSKVDFVANFMARAEFAGIYNGLSNDAYVQQLFNIAGVGQVTVPNVGVFGVAAMQSRLGAVGRAQVLRDIAESPEVSARFQNESTVVMHYFGYLRREPDAFYQDWINILTSTGNSTNVTNGFVNSQEYRARFGQ